MRVLSVISCLSWAGVVSVLFVYWRGTPKQFDWINVISCIPIALPAIIYGAYPSATISLSFGVIALIKVIRR